MLCGLREHDRINIWYKTVHKHDMCSARNEQSNGEISSRNPLINFLPLWNACRRQPVASIQTMLKEGGDRSIGSSLNTQLAGSTRTTKDTNKTITTYKDKLKVHAKSKIGHTLPYETC